MLSLISFVGARQVSQSVGDEPRWPNATVKDGEMKLKLIVLWAWMLKEGEI